MEKKRRICKICNRAFANGKAMGGHMRSHLAKFPIPPKPTPNQLPIPDYPTRPSPFSSSSQISPPKTSDLADVESGKFVVNAVLVQLSSAYPAPESVNSFSEDFPDEQVAMCLLMLKSDKRSKEMKQAVKRGRDEDDDEEDDEDEDEDEDEDDSFCVTHVHSVKSHHKYKCRTCKKSFRSHQALGGHKASHKNGKKYDPVEDSGFVNGNINQRNFECPFCDKVFESGQALGGHKKVHFSCLSAVKKSSEKSQHNFLDLNLPPEEDEEVSLQAVG